ncbi:MAG TPA: F0F1 ATP synthase subunit gamma [Thermoleophilaceae bacterium]|nr:F0F1 ATP synthase subunit gamma [Thermoleophilaceae bacterium]
MASQKDVKNRISSVRNIQKITRAMEMVAAARLRRAEQRIAALRPYASAIRRMTRRTAEAVENIPNMPLLEEHENVQRVGLLLVTGDRGLAGAFNSQIVRAGNRRAQELRDEGKEAVWYASGRRGVGSLRFRGLDVTGSYEGFTDRPAFADARDIAGDLAAAYVDGKVDRVEVIYNHYVSPLTQTVSRDVLLPLQAIEELASDDEGASEDAAADEQRGRRTSWLYEPEPEEILQRLVPDYIEITIFRALLESTASEHGARMTAMRNAQENAGDMIEGLTLEMNRQRQAEITQEIMEVVAGAEGLT